MAGGFHREWPDARGVFCNTSNEFIAWINERDHLRLITNAMGSDLQTCFLQFCEAHALLEAAIRTGIPPVSPAWKSGGDLKAILGLP